MLEKFITDEQAERLPHNRLLELLHYEKETGVFTWIGRTGRGSNIRIGDAAGSIDHYGYAIIYIGGKHYKAHRLAWFYVTGEWPRHQIDHKDMNKINNAWTNLREATHGQNQHNATIRTDNTSGYKGVHWNKHSKKWRARIMVGKKYLLLGDFDDITEAHEAYVTAAQKHHADFARAK